MHKIEKETKQKQSHDTRATFTKLQRLLLCFEKTIQKVDKILKPQF